MRKARRAAEMQPDPNEMPYPPYGFSPQPDPSNMYISAVGGHDQHQEANYFGPTPGGYVAYPPQQGQPISSPGSDLSNLVIPAPFLNNPVVTNVALEYGHNMLGQTKDHIDQQLNKYVSASNVKYYFSVDTSYVIKKLALLLFPFTHRDWSVKYNRDGPVQPRYELNAPDLYIPTMAFVTYVLVGGVSIGLQEQFSPEVLGNHAKNALICAFFEVLVIWLTFYVMNIETNLKALDILAFSSYKYVGMVVAIVVSFMLPLGYHAILIYVSIAIMFFLIRSLKVQVLPKNQNPYGQSACGGEVSKQRTYLLLFMAALQPLLMWLLTRDLVVVSR